MFSFFKKKTEDVPKPPTPSPVSGAPTAAASAQKSVSVLTKVKQTLKNAVNSPIPEYGLFSDVPESDYMKFHRRFDTLFERHHESADPGIKFLVNQLFINRTILESLSSKVVLKDTDREIVKLFFNPLKSLYALLLTKKEDEGLRNELANYNKFLLHLFDRGIGEMIRMQRKYDLALKQGKVLPKEQNEAGNAEKTEKAYKALDDMLAGLNRLPYMPVRLQAKLDTSIRELTKAMTALAKVSKTADATTAALATGVASALNGSNNGSAALVNGYAGPSMGPNELARIEAQLGKVEAGLNANNGFGAAHAQLNALNSKLNKYTGVNSVNPSNAEVNEYMNRLMREQTNQMMAKMPMPPTSAPKGGKRKSKTRKAHGRKTRKMRR